MLKCWKCKTDYYTERGVEYYYWVNFYNASGAKVNGVISLSVNPEITATPNDNGTYTLTLTKDPVIDWKGFANTDAFWTCFL